MMSISSTYIQYNPYKYDLINGDKDTNEETNKSDTIEELRKVNEETKSNYQLSFEEQSYIQHSMQLQSMITQLSINNNSSNNSSYTTVSNNILKGEQTITQLGVIDSNVSSTTEQKNQFISDKISSSTKEDTVNSDDENEYIEYTEL